MLAVAFLQAAIRLSTAARKRSGLGFEPGADLCVGDSGVARLAARRSQFAAQLLGGALGTSGRAGRSS
ncbi:hypothetical protein AU476_10465, partial [Cupriavidus sp. UYMSc13B]